MNVKLFWVGLILLFSPVLADEIITKEGDIFQGTIIQSTVSHVEIRDAGMVKSISHKDVLKIIFTSADVITLMNGQVYECKILVKNGPDVKVMTASGERQVKNAEIKFGGLQRW